jgi:Protein of unknown function (DUF3006)
MKVSIDRIEKGVAVLVMQDDPSGIIRIPVLSLPSGCREGDVLTLTLEMDPAETTAAKKRVGGLVDKLTKKRNGSP